MALRMALISSGMKNGQKSTEETYEGGELFGLSTKWSKSGHKESESTFKDGKLDGLKDGMV